MSGVIRCLLSTAYIAAMLPSKMRFTDTSCRGCAKGTDRTTEYRNSSSVSCVITFVRSRMMATYWREAADNGSFSKSSRLPQMAVSGVRRSWEMLVMAACSWVFPCLKQCCMARSCSRDWLSVSARRHKSLSRQESVIGLSNMEFFWFSLFCFLY